MPEVLSLLVSVPPPLPRKLFISKYLEARGSRTPVSYAYVHYDPAKAFSGSIQREYAVMEMPGWRCMLLVLLLGGEHWKNPESQYGQPLSAIKIAAAPDQNEETNSKKARVSFPRVLGYISPNPLEKETSGCGIRLPASDKSGPKVS